MYGPKEIWETLTPEWLLSGRWNMGAEIQASRKIRGIWQPYIHTLLCKNVYPDLFQFPKSNETCNF